MHLTMFGGTETDVTPDNFTAVTLFGGAKLNLPTLAARVMWVKKTRRPSPSRSRWEAWLRTDENLVVTLFGGAALAWPRIADEYLALAGVLDSGAVTAPECQALLERIAREPELRRGCRTMTLFGGCGRDDPDATEELRALAALERQGMIDERVHELLRALVGAGVEARIRGLQRVVAERGVAFAGV